MRCKKRVVRCIITNRDVGVIGENDCDPPSGECTSPDGCGGRYCNSVHAEDWAAQQWLLYFGEPTPAKAYITGHEYVCDDCKVVLAKAGVTDAMVVAEDVFNSIWEGLGHPLH